MKIRWLRIRNAASEIADCDVKLTISTTLNENLRGACVKDNEGLHIFLNAEWAKDEDSVLLTVAHELAHQDFPMKHSTKWKRRKLAILKELKKKMK